MLTNTKSPATHAIYRAKLKEVISATQKQIREKINATGSHIIHRTQAINAKRPYQTIDEEQEARQNILGEQIKVWRRILPTLLQKLFPELDSIPHADTLARFLETAKITEIESAHIAMIKHTSPGRNLKNCL